jgi:hypothetical protein
MHSVHYDLWSSVISMHCQKHKHAFRTAPLWTALSLIRSIVFHITASPITKLFNVDNSSPVRVKMLAENKNVFFMHFSVQILRLIKSLQRNKLLYIRILGYNYEDDCHLVYIDQRFRGAYWLSSQCFNPLRYDLGMMSVSRRGSSTRRFFHCVYFITYFVFPPTLFLQ